MSLFKPGQYVRYQCKDYKIPDKEFYEQDKEFWDHLPVYGAMTKAEFAEQKIKDATQHSCIECAFTKQEKHPEYVLLKIDSMGDPLGTREIETHVCENELRLSTRFNND